MSDPKNRAVQFQMAIALANRRNSKTSSPEKIAEVYNVDIIKKQMAEDSLFGEIPPLDRKRVLEFMQKYKYSTEDREIKTLTELLNLLLKKEELVIVRREEAEKRSVEGQSKTITARKREAEEQLVKGHESSSSKTPVQPLQRVVRPSHLIAKRIVPQSEVPQSNVSIEKYIREAFAEGLSREVIGWTRHSPLTFSPPTSPRSPPALSPPTSPRASEGTSSEFSGFLEDVKRMRMRSPTP